MLDASVAAAWYLPRQATPRTSALLKDAASYSWRAPYCFAMETANVLLSQELREALPPRSTELILSALDEAFELRLEGPPSKQTFEEALELARQHRISLFDGFYLLLAMDRGAVLATRDRALANAADEEGCAFDYAGPP